MLFKRLCYLMFYSFINRTTWWSRF